MSDRRELIWVEIDRLRKEADKLERSVRRHDDCIMLNRLDKFVDRHLMGFCIGMLAGIVVTVLRLKA